MLDIYESSGSIPVSTRPSLQHQLPQEQPTISCGPQISTDQMAHAIRVLKCTMKNATEILQAPNASECADAFASLINQGIASLSRILFEDEHRNTTDSSKGKKRAREPEEEEEEVPTDSEDSDPDLRPTKVLRLTEEIDVFFEKYGEPLVADSSQTMEDEVEAFFNFHAGSDNETTYDSELPTFMSEKALGKQRARDDGYQFDALEGESSSSRTLWSFEPMYTESPSFECTNDYSGLEDVSAAVPEDELSPENLFKYLKYAVENKSSDSTSEGLTSASSSDLTNAPSTSVGSASTAPNPSRRERAKLLIERRMNARSGLQYIPFTPSRLRNSISWSEVESSYEFGFFNTFEICASA